MTRRTVFRLLVAFSLVWAGWAGWSMIGRSQPYQLRVLDDLGSPIASAVVDVDGSQAGTTGPNGRVDLVWSGGSQVLEVSASGHISQKVNLTDAPEVRLDVVLKSQVLRGRVLDGEDDGIEGAVIDAGTGMATTDVEGKFEIRNAETGEVTVEKPAWQPTSFRWDGESDDNVVTIEPLTARGVYVGGPEVRDELAYYLQMAEETELNAMVIDLKDESGKVYFDTENATAIDVGAATDGYRLGDVVAQAHQRGLYLIGRLVLFDDPIAAVSKPEMAVWDADTNAPYEANGQFFLDPTDPEAARYGLDLAVEACSAGVDEIQLDYVRFPDSRRESATFDGGVSPEVRVSAISAVLTRAVATLHPLGCAVAADIFGYLTTATDDGGIGQRWEDVAAIVDVISPMLYPSHYHPEFFGFSSDANPGKVIDRALGDGLERTSGKVVVRPWLQDFDYDAAKVRAQIDMAENYGLGWMLWNPRSDVTTDALPQPQ